MSDPLLTRLAAAAEDGVELSTSELHRILEDPSARARLREMLSTCRFEPVMLPGVAARVPDGELPHIGAYHPAPSKTYATTLTRLSGEVPYDGSFNTDCGRFVGCTEAGEPQDLAACVTSLLLFLGHHRVDRDELVRRVRAFVQRQLAADRVETVDYASPLYFPGTAVGGRGEFVFPGASCKLQVVSTARARALLEDDGASPGRVGEEVGGNLAMLAGLAFGESACYAPGEPNPYHWGPRRLRELGIVGAPECPGCGEVRVPSVECSCYGFA